MLSGLPGLMAPQPTGDGLAAERMLFRGWKLNVRMRIVAVEWRKSFAPIEEKTLTYASKKQCKMNCKNKRSRYVK